MLRDYQKITAEKGLAILKEYGLLYLSMEVRTGKTRTALAIANDYGAMRVLILTKKKAIASIKMDFEAVKPTFDLYVTNYENILKIDPNDFDFVILDEAHTLGQFPVAANKVKIVKKICDLKPVVYLSGTPSPESFSQLYHQFYVSCNSPFKQWKSFYAWAKDFVKVKKKYFYNREVNDYNDADKEKIDQYTKHLFLSVSQDEAGFAQKVTEEILTVKMKDSTYWLVNKLIQKRIHIGKNGEEVVCDTEAKLQQKIHQIYSGTVKIDNKPGEVNCFDDTKARFIVDYFKGRKIAIFYCFKAELELLRWAFKGEITDSPEEFNKRDDLTFVCQIQSGSMGTNLSTADALVMYNIHFSSLQYQQARARLQHKDRQEPAPLYWVFAENGIEHKVYGRVIKKQDYTLAYFRKDFGVKSHPLNTMKDQLNSFMDDYGIKQINMGKTVIKNDRYL